MAASNRQMGPAWAEGADLDSLLRGGPDMLGGAGSLDLDLPSIFEADERVLGTGQFELGEDGEFREVMPEDDLMPVVPMDQGFAVNLADQVDPGALASIASDLLQLIEEDIASRAPWAERFRQGMQMMGLVEDEVDDGPFPGASTAVMPIISEATVQFWSRSLAEQVPSGGPFKGTVLGKQNKIALDRADRVASYMNHEVTYLDKSWYAEHSRMLFALPWQGSAFKKTYRDNILSRNVSAFVAAEDFICNYAFSDLESAPRFTHRIWRTRNEIRREQVAGFYRDIDLSEPSHEELPEEATLKLEVQDIEPQNDARDARHELFEVYCELDLPGFESPDGIALPYIVTIDKESEQVLAVYRDWREQDPLRRRRVRFVKYDFIPGVGFYALGLLHLIGGLQKAATGALRLIIDGAAVASIQGGFISRDASLRDERLVIEPGVWRKVEATAEDLSKAFFTPPFREPSPVLNQVLQVLVERSEKFAATTELMTGDTNAKNAPVGSTVALIEQGQKVFSTIHRGLHMSLANEARLRYELIQEYQPAEGYPYDVDGAHDGLMAEDFAPGIVVVPTSDPNISSQVQRVAINDQVYQLATQNPDILRRDVAIKRVLEGIRVPDVDELLVATEPPPPMDPVTQVQALLRGQPVQAYPDQSHVEHLIHLSSFANNVEFGGNPMVAQQVGPTLTALIGQHLAYAWATQARQAGVPVELMPPPIQPPDSAQPGEGGPGMTEPQIPQGGAPVDPSAEMGMPSDINSMGGFGPPQPDMPMPDMMGAPPADPALGAALPPALPQGGAMMGDMTGSPQQPVPTGAPPEMVAQLAAQIAPVMMQARGLPQPPDQGDQGKGDEVQAKVQIEQSKLQLKAEEQERTLAMKEREHQQKMDHAAQVAELKLQVEQMKAQAKIEAEQIKAQLAEMQAQQKAALEARRAQQQAEMSDRQMQLDEQRMQHEASLSQVEAAQSAAQAEQDMQLERATASSEMEIDRMQAAQAPPEAAGSRRKPAGAARPRGRRMAT